MKIQSIDLTNFKRFSNLTINGIPSTSKLVLLIGSNGNGKSSLFDGFDWISKGVFKGMGETPLYYRKDLEKESAIYITFDGGHRIRKAENAFEGPQELAKKFIGRSSVRIVPRITNNSNVSAIANDADGPVSYIDFDTRFINDVASYINQIDFALREPIFKGQQADTLKIFQDSIKPLNDSLAAIFGGPEETQLKIAEFANATPNSNAKLIFKKGESKISYELLSHGEKQVIILLLNFIVRKKYYEDTIIFIDEMDCHLNTSIQFKLIEEIVTKWIPDNSQLWTASHALGFIDYAKKSNHATVLDFDLLNFDLPQEIFPQSKDNLDIYEIAVPQHLLFELISGKKVVFCENQNDEFYQLAKIKGCLFVGLRDSRELFIQMKKDARSHCLRDRDFLMEEEIQRVNKNYPNYHVLKYYNFENYIYHPENIDELKLDGFSKENYLAEILYQKKLKYDSILTDIKSARNGYEEFKIDGLKSKEITEIIDSLKSDSFEDFYKFFDMKVRFSKKYLDRFNISKAKLCQTNWFKSAIEEIIFA
jgi:hypothetical protein